MPSTTRLYAMLWEIIWETLSDQFDKGLPVGKGDAFSHLDLQSSFRGALADSLEAEIYET